MKYIRLKSDIVFLASLYKLFKALYIVSTSFIDNLK
jgi:hypothetical protein